MALDTITITIDPQTAALLERIAANLDTSRELLAENERLFSAVIASELKAEIATPEISQDPPS